MKNIKMIIQYDGTKYNGWQKQNQKGSTAKTIQGKLENVLSLMTSEEVEVIGCGRTDSGVHADNYVANFFTKSNLNIEEMEKYLETYLPEDIIIKEIKLASERFHSRYNVKSKTYLYRINNKGYNDIFIRRYSHYIKEELDLDVMKKAAESLVGTHDFRSFTNLKAKSNKSTVRTINYINIVNKDGGIEIEVNGNGFLLNMVRIIVGTLIEVGLGEKKPSDISEILEGKNKELSGIKAPAKGLTLKELQY